MEVARGVIKNREAASHIRDFSGLAFGAKTPTDIDAFLDFGGEIFVIIEAKCGNASLEGGQKLAETRLCDACQRGGVETILIHASHPKTEEDIDYEFLPVVRVYYKGKWTDVNGKLTLRKQIVEFRNYIGREKLVGRYS